MLSLVDYEASDSEEESDKSEIEKCAHAQVFTDPEKGVNVIVTEKRNEDDYFGSTGISRDNADASDALTALISDEGTSVLSNLPSVVNIETKMGSEQLNDAQLEDIVKRKKWEVKLAEKAARKRRKKEKKAKRGKLEKLKKSDSEGTDVKPSKKARIEAFGGLTGLDHNSDEELGSEQLKPKGSVAANSVSNGLLSLLPQPKSETRIESKSANILLPNAVRVNQQQAKQDTKPQISKPKDVVGDEESDDSDVDSSDFFGLKSTSAIPTLGLDHDGPLPTVMSDVSYGPSKPTSVPHQNPIAVEADAATEGSLISHEVPSTSGMIDDSIAQQMIYSHDVVGWGGARQVAARAVEAMVDVSVDQALGPNVQANLLKNLHNRSLAEAAISHLSAIPKAKGPDSSVARRKHQITYLASVAVSREEQLAEQWSQNRHTKRMSSQKYGF